MASDLNAPAKPPLPRSLTRMDSIAPSIAPLNPFKEPRERAKTFNCIADADSPSSSSSSALDASHAALSFDDDMAAGDQPVDVFEQKASSDSDAESLPDHDARRKSGLDSCGVGGGGGAAAADHVDNDNHADASTPYDQLPIELLSMIDRFVNSLSAKSYTSPPSIDRISDLFQNFYLRANDHINTHIASLASRRSREVSPAHSFSKHSKSKTQSKDDSENTNEHQMLTPSEVTQRRKSRRHLQQKRLAMEEAVERRVCEAVYKKIWRHRTTMDEVRDEKLRSKTAALTVVGIDLKDLGVDIGDSSEETQKKINESLETARACLAAMNDEKYPLGKLQHLTAAHKAIVDTLTNVFPSNSSADEILPTLIYTLITGPPEGINIISNFLFIQRFRTASKIDGEAAYCLTNLEASISFLENVDLSSLRADEAQTSTPSFASGSDLDNTKSSTGAGSQGNAKTRLTLPPRPLPGQSPSRRLSDLFQPPAKVLGAANDAVRSTADQGLKNFTATLDNSLKFFLGRLNESQEKSPIAAVVPKTLDEARQLVSPSASADKDLESDDISVKDTLDTQTSQPQSQPTVSTPPPTSTTTSVEDRFIGLIGGRKPQRVENSDSTRAQRRIVSETTTTTAVSGSTAAVSTSFFQSNPSTNAFTSMRSFGNSLNPLSHIPDMIRGFGKNPEAEKEKEKEREKEKNKEKERDSEAQKVKKAEEGEEKETSPESAPTPDSRRDLTNIKPPIRRFVEIQDSSELRLAEIPELLEDYKRLASIIDNLSASQ